MPRGRSSSKALNQVRVRSEAPIVPERTRLACDCAGCAGKGLRIAELNRLVELQTDFLFAALQGVGPLLDQLPLM